MKKLLHSLHFILLVTILNAFVFPLSAQPLKKSKLNEKYVCTPCGQECDESLYDKAGKCTVCKMPLIKKSTVRFKSIDPANLCNYISEHPDAVLLDVRTKEEFEGKVKDDYGTLKNAINLPIQQLEKKIKTLNRFKQKEIIVFCSHSHRSPQAAYILNKNGFNKVTNLAGGMSEVKDKRCVK